MVTENLPVYTETDPSDRITVDSASQVTYVTLKRADGETHLSKDMGVDAIVEGTTLDFITQTDSSVSVEVSIVGLSVWANAVKGFSDLFDDGDNYFAVQENGYTVTRSRAIIQHYDGAVQTLDFGDLANVTKERLVKVSRSGDVYIAIWYNGATVGSGVEDTLTFAANSTPPAYRYHLPINAYNDGATDPGHSGHVRDYTFRGLDAQGGGLMGGGFWGQTTLMGGGIEI